MAQKQNFNEQDSAARFDALCDAFLTFKSRDEVKRFLIDLCTPGEMKDLSDRLYIARLLYHKKLPYREISAITGASTTTVGRVARFLEQEPHHGYKQLLENESE